MCAYLFLWIPLGVLLGPPIALAFTHPSIVVLLDEKEKPRCKITNGSNDFPASELDSLDALEECTELSFELEEIRMAGVPSPGKISGPALLAAGKIWAKTHGPAVAILSFATRCAMEEKNPAFPLFFIGAVSAVIFHTRRLEFALKLGFGTGILSSMGTIFIGRLAAELACDGE